MNKRIWTEEEDNYIKNSFGFVTFKTMSEYLGCSIGTVQRRAEELGFELEKKTVRRWTEEEIGLLKVMAPKYLNKTIAKKLNRPIIEVNKKARQLGIELIFRRPVWKKWKIKFLRENLNKMSLTKIMKELDVHYYQVIDKIEELGLELNDNSWTEDEEQLLTLLAPKVYIREIAQVLNRTEGAIISKARKMGLEYITLSRKYTDEELKYIKDNWGIISISEIAINLKVSNTMVQKQADLMNLPKLGRNPYKKWTEEEIDKLRNLSEKKTITQLATYFKTTNEAITTVAYRNSIELIDEKIHWTEEDNKLLREYAKTMDFAEIAKEMNRTSSAVRLQAKRQGIEVQHNKSHKDSIWTEDNSKQLQELVFQNKTLLEITKIMKKKDETIKQKARELGLELKKEDAKVWTDEEIIKLKELSKTKKLSEIVSELNRTSASIKYQAQRLGLSIKTDRKNWTEEEYKQLEKLTMIDKKSPKEIAEIMGRSEDSIIIKINRRGLKIQTNDKRFWTKEEETLLSDLWGSESVEKIAKKLNRTVSSIKNKVFLLGLGSQMENNYDGLKISEICDLFNVRRETVRIWVALGLNFKTRDMSKSRSYQYVEIKDLFEFLEKNQNIWDSRVLEKNILGKEPEWLQLKRKKDIEIPPEQLKLESLTKQQLILAKQFFLENREDIFIEEDTCDKEDVREKIKHNGGGKNG